jgi:hypothetical protein
VAIPPSYNASNQKISLDQVLHKQSTARQRLIDPNARATQRFLNEKQQSVQDSLYSAKRIQTYNKASVAEYHSAKFGNSDEKHCVSSSDEDD